MSVPLSLNFPQFDFVKPSSGFHPVTWEGINLQHLQIENEWRNATREKILREIRILQVHNLGAKCGWNGTGEKVSTR